MTEPDETAVNRMMIEPDTPDVTAGTVDEMVDYITNVICQRTTPNPDTNAARLANAIASSVIHRLRKTSTLTVRADEIEAAYERGWRAAADRYGHVEDLRHAVNECLARLSAAVDELRTKVPAA